MAAEPQPQGVSTARTNGRPADPMNASLTGLLDALRNDAAFASVADGTAEPAEDDIDASLIVGAPSGIRPALASAIASNGHTSQVVVIVSSSREAE